MASASVHLLSIILLLVLMPAALATSCHSDSQCPVGSRCWRNGCRRLPQGMRDSCVSSVDCINNVDLWADCSADRCQCTDGFFEEGGKCWNSQDYQVKSLATRLLGETGNRSGSQVILIAFMLFILCTACYTSLTLCYNTFRVKRRTLYRRPDLLQPAGRLQQEQEEREDCQNLLRDVHA